MSVNKRSHTNSRHSSIEIFKLHIFIQHKTNPKFPLLILHPISNPRRKIPRHAIQDSRVIQGTCYKSRGKPLRGSGLVYRIAGPTHMAFQAPPLCKGKRFHFNYVERQLIAPYFPSSFSILPCNLFLPSLLHTHRYLINTSSLKLATNRPLEIPSITAGDDFEYDF
jgi:hypothetical protein